MKSRFVTIFSIIFLICFVLTEVSAQLGKITVDLQKDKPEKFKNRTLKSEKTGQKKFTLPRRFIQNTVSHYNYFFNANSKLNSVIERARMSTKDDYSKLLPYYSYSLENTSTQKSELDSVILKSTAGILLHDLRSDWVDNLYFLIGKAYYLRRDFDSAAMTFQFINYNLPPRKKKSDDKLIVGSNDYASSKGISISSKEDRNIIDKAFSRPPSRNDALVWQIRTYIDNGDFSEAAGLINTLKNDVLFPERLMPELAEMQGYWFFKQQMYDSAILYMENALPNALDIADKARREFLLAQLLEIDGNLDTATNYYDKAIRHTTDPLMDIYANLNKAKMLDSNDPAKIQKGIDRLLQMAKRDKYELYRDIVYYSAAQLALEIPDTTSALSYFKKSVQYNDDNIAFQNKAFLSMAELSYDRKDYENAYIYYDSLQLPDSTLGNPENIRERKNALARVVKELRIINREDSLQKLAGLSEAEREAFLKKLSKRLQKERGLTDEDGEYSNSAAAFFGNKNASGNIFANNEAKGEWYFYNNAIKSKGYNEFKRIWGKRQNVDNWRRISGNEKMNNLANDNRKGNIASVGGDPMAPVDANEAEQDIQLLENINDQEDISIEGLLKNIPLTKPAMDSSNKKVSVSLYQLGKNYQTLLEDYPEAINTYEKSLKRFPDSLYNGEIYMNLSYCYNKTGNIAKSDYYKNLLLKNYGNTKFADYVLHPEKYNPSKKDTAATNRYTNIYNQFIEGNFEAAIADKKSADSLYGVNYWSPQLLYIESMYHVRQGNDSVASSTLYQLIAQFPKSPMRAKAVTMLDVLNRKDSIVKYLTNLKVERIKEDSEIVVFDDTKISGQVQAPVRNEITNEVTHVTPQIAELNPERKLPPPVSNANFTFDPMKPQNVVMMLTKVDQVYANEAKNAFVRYNREKYYSQNLEIKKDTLDADRSLLVISSFETAELAMKYLEKIRKDAATEVSWLPADKYSFYLISNSNLEILLENKKLINYLDLLNSKYPGKF